MRLWPLTVLSLVASVATGAAAPRTVVDYAQTLESAAARLDTLVTARQKLGDMAAAERLALVSAMVRRSGDEFRGAEQTVMTDDVSHLPATVRERLVAATETAAKAETHADYPGFVDDAQRVFNALLAALPVDNPHPVFYGVLSRDIDAAPADLVVYGYRLVDPKLKTPPVASYRNAEIAVTSAEDDRLDLTLSPELKAAVDFAPPPCEQRQGFAIRLTGAYSRPRGLWPIRWTEKLETAADLYVLPTPVAYAVRIVARIEAPTEETRTVPFSAKSELTVADCGETRSAAIDVALPAGYKNLTCAGAWIEASGATQATGRCEPRGPMLHVSGEISGGQKVCSPDKLCTCPSSAQGFLQASGSYQLDAPGATLKSELRPEPLTFPAGGLAERNFAETAGWRRLSLGVSRRGCPTETDSLDLNLAHSEDKTEALSKTGAFRAVFQRGALTVGALDAYPTALDRTP